MSAFFTFLKTKRILFFVILIVLIAAFGIYRFWHASQKLPEPQTHSTVTLDSEQIQSFSQGDEIKGKGVPDSKVSILLSPDGPSQDITADAEGQWIYTLPKDLSPKGYRLNITAFDKIGQLTSFQSFSIQVEANQQSKLLNTNFVETVNAQTIATINKTNQQLFVSSFNSSLQQFNFQVPPSTYSRYLLLGIAVRKTGKNFPVVTQITYGNQTLTPTNGYLGAVTDGVDDRVEIWGLTAPITGSNPIKIQLSGNTGVVVVASSWSGVHQSSSVGNFYGNSANSNSPAVNVASGPGQVVVDMLSAIGTTVTIGPGQSNTLGTGGSGSGASSFEAGAASVNMSWTLNQSTKWAIGAVNLKPALYKQLREQFPNEYDAVYKARETRLRRIGVFMAFDINSQEEVFMDKDKFFGLFCQVDFCTVEDVAFYKPRLADDQKDAELEYLMALGDHLFTHCYVPFLALYEHFPLITELQDATLYPEGFPSLDRYFQSGDPALNGCSNKRFSITKEELNLHTNSAEFKNLILSRLNYRLLQAEEHWPTQTFINTTDGPFASSSWIRMFSQSDGVTLTTDDQVNMAFTLLDIIPVGRAAGWASQTVDKTLDVTRLKARIRDRTAGRSLGEVHSQILLDDDVAAFLIPHPVRLIDLTRPILATDPKPTSQLGSLVYNNVILPAARAGKAGIVRKSSIDEVTVGGRGVLDNFIQQINQDPNIPNNLSFSMDPFDRVTTSEGFISVVKQSWLEDNNVTLSLNGRLVTLNNYDMLVTDDHIMLIESDIIPPVSETFRDLLRRGLVDIVNTNKDYNPGGPSDEEHMLDAFSSLGADVLVYHMRNNANVGSIPVNRVVIPRYRESSTDVSSNYQGFAQEIYNRIAGNQFYNTQAVYDLMMLKVTGLSGYYEEKVQSATLMPILLWARADLQINPAYIDYMLYSDNFLLASGKPLPFVIFLPGLFIGGEVIQIINAPDDTNPGDTETISLTETDDGVVSSELVADIALEPTKGAGRFIKTAFAQTDPTLASQMNALQGGRNCGTTCNVVVPATIAAGQYNWLACNHFIGQDQILDCDREPVTIISTAPLPSPSSTSPSGDPPNAAIIGPSSGTVGNPLQYLATATGTRLTGVEVYVSPINAPQWQLKGGGLNICNETTRCPVAGDVTANWTPTAPGTYYVAVNAYSDAVDNNLANDSGENCSGSPFIIQDGWSDCGPSDFITVTVTSTAPSGAPPTASITRTNSTNPPTFSATAQGDRLRGMEIFVSIDNQSNPDWKLLAGNPYNCSTSPCTTTGILNAPPGNYVIVVNAYSDANGDGALNGAWENCSGNPWTLPALWEDCDRGGSSDLIRVTIPNTTVQSPTANISATNNSYPIGQPVSYTASAAGVNLRSISIMRVKTTDNTTAAASVGTSLCNGASNCTTGGSWTPTVAGESWYIYTQVAGDPNNNSFLDQGEVCAGRPVAFAGGINSVDCGLADTQTALTFIPPTATISGPNSIVVGQPVTYNATASGVNLRSISILRVKTTGPIADSLASIASVTCNGFSPCSTNGSWTPTVAGESWTIYVEASTDPNFNSLVIDTAETCIGGPTTTLPGYADCGLADNITLSVTTPFNYSLPASLANLPLGSTGSNLTNLAATLSSGTTQNVSFTTSALPAGTTAAFSPTGCNPTCTTTLTFTTSSAPVGTYPISITGSPLNKTTSLNLVISDTTLPSTPANLTATAISSSQVNLAWTAAIDNVGVTGYDIYRCSGINCTPSTILTSVGAVASYNNTGLTAGTTYRYFIKAKDAAGNLSLISNTATASTISPSPSPSPISKPDLTINSVTSSVVSPILGTNFDISAVLANIGTADTTQALQLIYRFFKNGATSDMYNTSFTIDPPLVKNSSTTRTASSLSSDYFGVGSYRIQACADSLSAINELNETNNCRDLNMTIVAPSPSPSPSALPGTCPTGLVSYWKMNEASGIIAADSIGSNTATSNGTTTAGVAGKLGNARSFNGSTGYLSTAQNLNSWLGGTASVSFWIKTNQVGKDIFWQAPGVTGVESGDTNDVRWGWIDTAGKIHIDAGNGTTATSPKAVNDNLWHHVVLTRNSTSGQVQVYLDNSTAATGTSDIGTKTTSFSSIGRIPGSTAGFFNGSLDEFGIWNRVLSASEVSVLFNSNAGLSCGTSTPSPSPSPLPSPSPSPLVAASVTINGQTKTIAQFQTTPFNLHLPGTVGTAQTFTIPVTVNYTNGTSKNFNWTFNYQPPVPTPSPSLSPTPTPQSPTPTPIPSPSGGTTTTGIKRVFVTSSLHNGNLGGLSGADNICYSQASGAKLSGDWKAWLSSSAGSAASRLTKSSGAYKLLNGSIIANNWTDLTDGTIAFPIKIDQTNTDITSSGSYVSAVWTNTSSAGANDTSTNNCLNWSTNQIYTNGLNQGSAGNITNTDNRWTNSGIYNCDASFHLYCIEQ